MTDNKTSYFSKLKRVRFVARHFYSHKNSCPKTVYIQWMIVKRTCDILSKQCFHPFTASMIIQYIGQKTSFNIPNLSSMYDFMLDLIYFFVQKVSDVLVLSRTVKPNLIDCICIVTILYSWFHHYPRKWAKANNKKEKFMAHISNMKGKFFR